MGGRACNSICCKYPRTSSLQTMRTICLQASRYLAVTSFIVFILGEVLSVSGTEYDFQKETSLGTAVPKARNGEGYCVNYCVGAEKDGIR